MQIIVDNQIVKILIDTDKVLENPVLLNPENQIRFAWPSLFEYLKLGEIFSSIPAFDSTHPLFEACVLALCQTEKREVLFELYDRLFAENLNQIKSLTQINVRFLLQAIKEQRQKSLKIEKLLFSTLNSYEDAFTENPSYTMHDLILYLAWDRMCVCLARLFDYQLTDVNFIKGIEVLKDCLIESYQHIVQQGRTSPSIYRMLEALFFYQMREENLQKLSETEWQILSQSFSVLKAQDKLVDFLYIDQAIVVNTSESDLECYLTADSSQFVNARLVFAECMIAKLKLEVPSWTYSLISKKIFYLNL